MLEDFTDTLADQRHDALVRLARGFGFQRKLKLSFAEQRDQRPAAQVFAVLRHAAQVQLFVTVDDQQRNRALAA